MHTTDSQETNSALSAPAAANGKANAGANSTVAATASAGATTASAGATTASAGATTANAKPASKPDLIHPQSHLKISNIVLGVVIAILAAMLVSALVGNEAFRWDLVFSYLFDKRILRGVLFTILLTVGAMIIGIILALTMALWRQSTNPLLRGVAWVYIWFFRGTPIYTQLIFWGLLPSLYSTFSLGIPFGPEFITFETSQVFTPLVSALLGLGLNEGAYLAEIIRTGFQSIDPGQREAALALGMTPRTITRRIIFPQAMRIIIPPTGNETISMLKTTSLVVAVPFTLELTFTTTDLGSQTYLPIPFLMVAAIWYLAITSVLMVGQARLERHFGRGHNPRANAAKAAGAGGEPENGAGLASGGPGTGKGRAGAATARGTQFLDVTP
ncbi:amino acid ABC transporter permease [Actinobaculum suis]|uniref:amino acid ABC transporter permease n=1 Tax=Actinobaculum suis TaxID=1657 RepID=UPI00069E4C02|nr:ABC transporter permease subunit [Actinobaculum suis]